MNEDSDSHDNPHGETPLRPAFDFNDPGTSVALYEGPIAGLADGERPGRIELNCGPRVGLRWYADLQPGDHGLRSGDAKFTVRRDGQDWAVDAHQRGHQDGWINMAAFPRPNARLQRVLAHWMNLPKIDAPVILSKQNAGTQRWWRGRWQVDVDGWHLTLTSGPTTPRPWRLHMRRTSTY